MAGAGAMFGPDIRTEPTMTTAHSVLNIAAFIAVLPATVAGLRGLMTPQARIYWPLLAVAVAGPVVWTVADASYRWHTDLAFALWISVSASMVTFALSAVFAAGVARLAPVFLALMAVLAGLAMLSYGHTHPSARDAQLLDGGWFWLHILVSVATYALLAVAAAAALAALIQERALKKKRPLTTLAGLPSVLDCEGVVVRFLWLSEAVLALGMATGWAINLTHEAPIMTFDHKTVFAIAAFVVIGALLIAHERTGARGRQVARLVLLSYLFVTLAYPGVKFVTGVLLG